MGPENAARVKASCASCGARSPRRSRARRSGSSGEGNDRGRARRPRRWRAPVLDPLDDRHELLSLRNREVFVELEDAQAGLGGAQEDVGIDEPGEQPQVGRLQELLERPVGGHGAAHLVGDDRHRHAARAHPAPRGELAQEVGRRMQVDGRGHHRHEDAVGALEHLLEHHARRARGGIDHQPLGAAGHVAFEAAQPVTPLGRAVRAMDGRGVRRAQPQPVHARPLRVVVHQRGRYVGRREAAGQVGGDGRLARAALRVEHQGGLHFRARFCVPFFLCRAWLAARR